MRAGSYLSLKATKGGLPSSLSTALRLSFELEAGGGWGVLISLHDVAEFLETDLGRGS